MIIVEIKSTQMNIEYDTTCCFIKGVKHGLHLNRLILMFPPCRLTINKHRIPLMEVFACVFRCALGTIQDFQVTIKITTRSKTCCIQCTICTIYVKLDQEIGRQAGVNEPINQVTILIDLTTSVIYVHNANKQIRQCSDFKLKINHTLNTVNML